MEDLFVPVDLLAPGSRDEIVQLQKLFIRVAIGRGMLEKRGDKTLTPLRDYLGEEFEPFSPVVIQ